MPRLPDKVPSYRLQRSRGLAVVTLNGKDHYLGRWNSPESRVEYDRLIGEWLASGRGRHKVEDSPGPNDTTVGEVLLAFWKFGESYYRDPQGQPSRELSNFKDALKPVRRLYGKTPARSFGPLSLRAVRDDMVKAGLARTTINARVNRIRHVFKWAVSVEMVPSSVVESLRAVDGLRKGKTKARESEAIGPVPIERVEKTIPHMKAPVAAMVRLQLLTGCRAGEIRIMRGGDIVPGVPVWEYRPGFHKGTWRDKDRVIPLGPKAQDVVKAFLKPDLSAFLFDPRDAVADHHRARKEARKSKPTPSERAKRCKGRPGMARRPRYDRNTYGQSIARACDKAFPHPVLSAISPKKLTAEQRVELREWRRVQRWSPLQLRHTAGTLIRARFGLEAAQVVLGHARADVTQVYAERDLEKAKGVMAEVG